MADTETKKTEYIRPLAHLHGEIPPAPEWFRDNIAMKPDEGHVTVDGARIHWLAWGDTGKPGLLFVHGGRAHARWWAPFAPFFAQTHRVAAIDLSGMGDSGHRTQYSMSNYVDELFAVCDAAGLNLAGRPLFVGHSFGGYCVLAAVEHAGERLSGAVVVDSPIMPPDPDEGYNVRSAAGKPSDKKKIHAYADIAEPIARFRFLPNQPCEHLFLADYIARNGLKQIDTEDGGKGWVWKFDSAMGANFDIHFERDLFVAARCPLAFLYGEKSMFSNPEMLGHLKKAAAARSPFIMLPDAHHHLMMDQPIAFIGALRTLFSTWPVKMGF